MSSKKLKKIKKKDFEEDNHEESHEGSQDESQEEKNENNNDNTSYHERDDDNTNNNENIQYEDNGYKKNYKHKSILNFSHNQVLNDFGKKKIKDLSKEDIIKYLIATTKNQKCLNVVLRNVLTGINSETNLPKITTYTYNKNRKSRSKANYYERNNY